MLRTKKKSEPQGSLYLCVRTLHSCHCWRLIQLSGARLLWQPRKLVKLIYRLKTLNSQHLTAVYIS